MADTADMSRLQALIFDVDGTLADTEEVHRLAFNRAFAEYGIPWEWSPALYERLLAISGGRERIEFYMRELLAQGPGEILTPDLIRELHARKTAIYAEMLRIGQLRLRPGVERLLREARDAGLELALATSSARSNLETLLDMNLPGEWRAWFGAIESCDTVQMKKPSPAVYLAALRGLDLPATACMAFEDTLNGLNAARAAGLVTVITTHRYTQARHFPGAALVTDGFGEPDAPCAVIAGSLAGERCVTIALLRRLLEAAAREQAPAVPVSCAVS
ncbi:MAG TPA: HAD-IA family hydrolase [Gammaproteobacteria bacterium]|nr:HAD-IA family hydrolase [Gammaproteobacteria bacterium]